MKNQDQYNLLQVSQNLFCVREFHEPFKLSRLCLNNNCKLSRLMCVNCENDHFDHRLETFSFYEIQNYMNETIGIKVNLILEQLDKLRKLFDDTINQIKNDFLKMNHRFLSMFPKIDNTSYKGIQKYVDILMANIQLSDRIIVFKGYSQIFRSIKRKIGGLQFGFNKINDVIENIINDNLQQELIEPIQEIKQRIEQNDKKKLVVKNNCSLKQISNNICCKKKDHQFGLIVNVCLFSQCQVDRLQCRKCIKDHYNHRQFCIPIIEFDETCALFTVDNQQENRIKQIKKQLDDIVNDLDQDFLNILKPNLFIQMYLEKNEIYNYEDLNTAVEQLTNYVEINDKGDLKFKLSQENVLNNYIHSKFKNCAWNMYDLIKKQEPFIETAKVEQAIQQPQLLKDEINQQSIFHLQNCSYTMDIINFKVVKKLSNTISNDVALLSKDIDPKLSKSYLFKINNQNGVIGLGFGNALKIQQQGYILTNLSKLGNGIYMIASYPGKQAISYNDKDQNFNDQRQAINFQQGHSYRLIYDPKNGNGEQFCIDHIIDSVVVEQMKMPMVIKFSGHYHPFILIGLRDDEVELLMES